MKKAVVSVFIIAGLGGAGFSESVTNNLDVQGGFIYNHGVINPGDVGLTFTNAGVRDITVSVGQLSGVDPETGEVITNATNLLSLKAESLTTASNIVAGGFFIGDGSGISNLNVDIALPQGSVDAGKLSTNVAAAFISASDIAGWNAGKELAENIQISGGVITVSTNLTVQGMIRGDGSGLSGVAAGGDNGELQFNEDGVLTGNPDFFLHPTEKKPAFRSQSGNFFRGYNSETISDRNLIYSLRNENGISVLRMRRDGQDAIRLSGSGDAYISGNLQMSGQLFVDGATNLSVQAQIDGLANSPAALITSEQILHWNSGGSLAETVQISGETVNIATNLTVQGTISGDGSGLNRVAAGGSSGSIQFNDNGVLSGNTNFFVHAETGKLAFHATEGNLFRAFKGSEVSDENLIYVLRRFEGTTELCMLKDGVETIRLRGDGSIYATGALEVGGLSLGGGGTSGSTGWFIPEEGDLSMGSFTQQ